MGTFGNVEQTVMPSEKLRIQNSPSRSTSAKSPRDPRGGSPLGERFKNTRSSSKMESPRFAERGRRNELQIVCGRVVFGILFMWRAHEAAHR
jgi:hypothetical protein